MILKGVEGSSVVVKRDENLDKYLICLLKEIANGCVKGSKVVADNFVVHGDHGYSFEIGGMHYTMVEGMDFTPMFDRIIKTRSYRKYKLKLAA
ncbi:MAG: hypothetical protein N4A43_02555 [Alphaproteobacteria bacterium]|nr:hypothetical protein [Alphaproteobacteria bacterium]